MLISNVSRLYALAINLGVKDANPLSSTLFVIFPTESTLGKIHPTTSAQGKISSLVDTLVILDLNMLSYRAYLPNLP